MSSLGRVTAPVVVELFEPGHLYQLDGERVPGVTEVRTGLGLIDASRYTEWGRIRGSVVHKAARYYLEGDLDWSSIDPRIRGYVEAVILFAEDAKLQPEILETPLGSVVYRFAGTTDYIGPAFGSPAVVDWKSGSLEPTTGLALAAYDVLAGWLNRRRIAVQLTERGRYMKRDYEDRRDYSRFLNALDLYKTFLFRGGNRA